MSVATQKKREILFADFQDELKCMKIIRDFNEANRAQRQSTPKSKVKSEKKARKKR